MKLLTRVSIVIGVSFLSVLASGCSTKHAILVSSNNVTADDVAYHSVWWYDLIQQYDILRKNGFKDKNIHVLYGTGPDFDSTYSQYNAMATYGHTITDMAANKTNVQAVFNNIKRKVKKRDFLYVWWMGHGSGSGADQCDLSMDLSHTGEHVSDVEFRNYVGVIGNYRKRNVAIMTCHAGGMLDNFDVAGSDTVTLTSSTCAASSYEATTSCDGLNRADFNMTFTDALALQNACGAAVASDSNGNGYVSIFEAHQYNQANMTTSVPQIADPDNLAASTHIKKRKP